MSQVPEWVFVSAREAANREGRMPRPIRVSRHRGAWYLTNDADRLLVGEKVYQVVRPEALA